MPYIHTQASQPLVPQGACLKYSVPDHAWEARRFLRDAIAASGRHPVLAIQSESCADARAVQSGDAVNSLNSPVAATIFGEAYTNLGSV
jgi:hypothetical protein